MKPRLRIEVVYMALQRPASREIMRKVATKDYTEYGDDNALLKDLAKIVDTALQAEIDRRKAGATEGTT